MKAWLKDLEDALKKLDEKNPFLERNIYTPKPFKPRRNKKKELDNDTGTPPAGGEDPVDSVVDDLQGIVVIC